jgi:hypothetical protein
LLLLHSLHLLLAGLNNSFAMIYLLGALILHWPYHCSVFRLPMTDHHILSSHNRIPDTGHQHLLVQSSDKHSSHSHTQTTISPVPNPTPPFRVSVLSLLQSSYHQPFPFPSPISISYHLSALQNSPSHNSANRPHSVSVLVPTALPSVCTHIHSPSTLMKYIFNMYSPKPFFYVPTDCWLERNASV